MTEGEKQGDTVTITNIIINAEPLGQTVSLFLFFLLYTRKNG